MGGPIVRCASSELPNLRNEMKIEVRIGSPGSKTNFKKTPHKYLLRQLRQVRHEFGVLLEADVSQELQVIVDVVRLRIGHHGANRRIFFVLAIRDILVAEHVFAHLRQADKNKKQQKLITFEIQSPTTALCALRLSLSSLAELSS